MRLAGMVLACVFATCAALASQEQVDVAVLDELDGIVHGSTEEDNGWPLYEEVLRDFRFPPDGAYFACKNVPGSPDWEPLGTWLNDNRDSLPTLVTASRRARYGLRYRPCSEVDAPMASVSLLHSRLLVNLLCVAAREAEADGLLDRAIEYVHSAHRIGAQIADRPTLTDQMIGTSLIGIASREARRLLVDRAEILSRQHIESMAGGPLVNFHSRPAEDVMRFEQRLFPEHYGDDDLVQWTDWLLRKELERVTFQIEATRAVLAIIGYRSANGCYPESLDALEPDLLGGVDRYRYSPPGTHGLVLYRLGEDGEDDLATVSLNDLTAGRIHRAYLHQIIVPVR